MNKKMRKMGVTGCRLRVYRAEIQHTTREGVQLVKMKTRLLVIMGSSIAALVIAAAEAAAARF